MLIQGEYFPDGRALSEGDNPTFQSDVNGNLKVTLGTKLDRQDIVTADDEGYTYVNLTASGQILAGPGKIAGFYVNSTNAGTIRISDALTATTPYFGGTMTPAVGPHAFGKPVILGVGGYVTIGGTAIDVTFKVKAD